jgi:mannose-1-phosphate guanylyltransferase/phosphomannomutase
MRAILLSAGRGERLKPLTDSIQKNMLPLNGKPLLHYWVDLLKKYDIKEIAINLYYLGRQIEDYFGDGERFGINIKYSKQETLLGQAAAIKRIEQLYPGFCSEGPFLVIYADNLSDMNLGEVIEFHKKNDPIVTLTLHKHDEPWTRGVVDTDEEGKVLRFIEKPEKQDILSGRHGGDSASCVYIFAPEVLNHIENEEENLGKDLFPKLLQRGYKIYAFNPNAYVQDIGTIERYEKAKKDFEKR